MPDFLVVLSSIFGLLGGFFALFIMIVAPIIMIYRVAIFTKNYNDQRQEAVESLQSEVAALRAEVHALREERDRSAAATKPACAGCIVVEARHASPVALARNVPAPALA